MMNKRAATGEMVLMIYRLFLVAVIAVIVLGVSSIIYSHHISIRTSEAMLMTRHVVDCLSPEGVIEASGLSSENIIDLSEICNIRGGEIERFFVNTSIVGSSNELLFRFHMGDSGITWVKDMFDKLSRNSLEKVKLSEPGFYREEYNTGLDSGGSSFGDVKMIVEVVVRDENG